MEAENESDYISAVFIHLLQPIADLCDRMLSFGCDEPNEVQTSVHENGYAISIIALAAFLLEGVCGRTRYIGGIGSQKKQPSAAQTLSSFGGNNLAEKIEEIFVVRDAIAHSHLWEAKITWEGDELRFEVPPKLLVGYGDNKFDKIVDLNSRTTRCLKLDVFPPRIHWRTAVIVLKQCAEALRFLESRNINYVHLWPHHVRVAGRLLPFYKWVDELPV